MGDMVRVADRINTAPRYSEADAVRLNNMFRGRDTVEMLTALLRENMLGDAAIVSSFGAESAVLLHLIAAIDPSVPVLFLDTGKHFPETITFREELRAMLGLRDLRILKPDPALLSQKDETGLRWSYDPDGCCNIRKVLPLSAALARFDAQFTGRKAFQSSTRSALPRFEIEVYDHGELGRRRGGEDSATRTRVKVGDGRVRDFDAFEPPGRAVDSCETFASLHDVGTDDAAGCLEGVAG